MHAVVSSKLDKLADVCRRFHVRRLEVFDPPRAQRISTTDAAMPTS